MVLGWLLTLVRGFKVALLVGLFAERLFCYDCLLWCVFNSVVARCWVWCEIDFCGYVYFADLFVLFYLVLG